ncbi:uncharacterized protein LOC144438730 [Glandiceps talaboti]
MATDEGGEKEFLKLASPVRKHTFARMVSWEFSRPIEPKKRKRNKKQRREEQEVKDRSSDDDDDDEGKDIEETEECCESDEYFTADEDISESTDEELSLENLNITETPLPQSERHGSRSKSQKRRRKRIFRQDQLDFFAPFVDDVNNDIEPVKSDNLHVVKSVPSLMEICLKACQQTSKGSLLPITRHQREVLKDRQVFHSLQLKWLHRNIAINEKNFEPTEIICNKSGRFILEDGLSKVDNSELFVNVRAETVRSIPVKISKENKGDNQARWELAALVHAIDLMLPSSFKHRGSTSTEECDETAMNKARQAAVMKVKIALRARYPRLIEHLFDIALAYVWWARGHLPQASQMLCHAAEKINPVSADMKKMKSYEPYLQKAMYLNDSGLMYAMFGDPTAAAKCYRQAAEVSCSAGGSVKSHDLLVLQSLILAAAAWDQGLMNKTRAVNSCSAWSAVMASPKDCPPEVTCAAVEAFLCFHAGMSTDPSIKSDEDESCAWLHEAKNKLEKLMKNQVMFQGLNLYYAFVLAMLGMGTESLHALRSYSACCDGISHPHGFPARQIRNASRSSIVQPLVTAVQQTHKSICAIPLLWRRQFTFPIISQKSVNIVADKQSELLNLHINDEGYLTGDIYLNLPSMRGILLDPYDGSVCIAHTPSVSEPWLTSPSTSEFFWCEDQLPVPYCVYSDSTRHVTVNLVSVQQLESHGCCNQAFYMQWRSPEQFYQLNLRKMIRQKLREELLKQARKDCDEGKLILKKFVYDEIKKKKNVVISNFEERKKKFEEHYERGWDLNYSHVFASYPCVCGEKADGDKKGRRHKNLDKFNIRLVNVAYYGEATVLVMVNASHKNGIPNADTLIFLDMSSFETFSKPVIYFVEDCSSPSLYEKSTIPLTHCSYPKHQDVNVICVGQKIYKSSSLGVTAFDEHGSVLKTVSLPFPDGGKPYRLSHGTGSLLFGLIIDGVDGVDEMGRVVAHDMKHDGKWNSVDLFQPRQLVAGYNTIFIRTETALVLLDAPTLLSVEVTFNKLDSHNDLSGQWLNKELQNIDVLASRKITRLDPSGQEVDLYRLVFTADTKVYLLDRSCQNSDEGPAPLNVTTEVDIGGIAKEAHYISEEVGFVVAVTLNEEEDTFYKEYLYWYSNHGNLRGVLPFLGKGPHNFYSVHLSGKEGQLETQGWYLYFTDGYGAICCTKLF